MDYKIDYMTITIKPDGNKIKKENENLWQEAYRHINEILMLQRYADCEDRGQNKYYSEILAYREIVLKVSSEEKFENQGFCVEMSGEALAHYVEWLNKRGMELIDIIEKWRLLACEGWKTRVTRIDIAIDDFNGVITVPKIERAIKKREFVSRFHSRPERIKEYVVKDIQTLSPDGGHTINIGKRTSNTYCRFYDKRAEQIEKGNKCDYKYWTRCEFEFKNANAMSVVNALLDGTPEEFGKYIRCVINNYISFIDYDNERRTRCTVKKWWSKFINVVEKSKLTVGKVQKNAYISKMRWFRRSVFPSLYALLSVHRLYEVLKMVENDGVQRVKKQRGFIEDFKGVYNNTDVLEKQNLEKLREITGLEEWAMRSDVCAGDDCEAFRKHINERYIGRKPERKTDLNKLKLMGVQFGWWREWNGEEEYIPNMQGAWQRERVQA